MLHLIKLAVGIHDPAHLRAVQAQRLVQDPPLRHLTRQMPRRAPDIADGGSMYWVIAGTVLLRQRVLAVEPAVRADGSACAALMLDPVLVPVRGRPVKAFQGWRYLAVDAAPPDLDVTADEADLPEALARELRALCLL
jgi:hypothetical protein